jgi:hypothetical protein
MAVPVREEVPFHATLSTVWTARKPLQFMAGDGLEGGRRAARRPTPEARQETLAERLTLSSERP